MIDPLTLFLDFFIDLAINRQPHFLFAFAFYENQVLSVDETIKRKTLNRAGVLTFDFSYQLYYNLSRGMKFKTEYRWLLFILIPFIVLLVIHILCPLMLLLNSQPISVKAYEEFNIDAIDTNSRSYLHKQSQQIASFMSRFANLGSRLGAMLTQKWSNLGNTTNKINNAYQYNQGIGGAEQNRSMWFAQNKTGISQLNSQQKNVYERYSQVQPYLVSSGFTGYQGQITGIFVSFNLPDSEIAFHYPSYHETQYKDKSASIITQPYDLMAKSPTTHRFNTVNYGSNFVDNTTSLCTAIKNNSEMIGVICIEINLQVLLEDIIDEFEVSALTNIRFNLRLVQPSTQTVLSEMYHFQGYSNLSFPKGSNWTYFNSYWDASSCRGHLKPVDFYATVRQQAQTVNVVAICLGGSQQQSQPPTLVYSLTFELKNLSTHLVQAYTYSQGVENLLIPILISIIVSIVITVVVLRYILNSLDFELFKINEYCKFIVSGDISINIPQFVGTQDIIQLYERVKIINRLFRYTSKQYFTGYYSNKILKYVEAIQLFKKLNYDPSFLYENIGDCYLYIQQYEKSISFLKQSIDIVQNEIVCEYGSLQKVMKLKLEKEFRFSQAYKQNQIIMTRRLWKVFFVYMKYVQLGMLNSKNFFGQNLSEQQKKQKKDRYHSEMVKNVTKLKQIMYPDYGLFAEGALMFLFEAKFNFSCKNYEAGKSGLEKATKYVNMYSKEFESNGNKIKQKGSKSKFFFKKNKMSGHSRCKPQICQAFLKKIEAISKVNDPKHKDYTGSIECLFDAVRSNYISQSVNFMIMSQIRKQLNQLKIGLSKFEHTHIFRQTMPYKTLHYGPITPQVQPSLYRIPKSVAEVELRQFLFMYDTANLEYPSAYCQKHISYMKQRSEFIFDKYVKVIDRVSITKFNNISQVETGCNLTLKEFNEQIMKKTFKDYLRENNFAGKTWLVNAISKIIQRVKNLQCQKVMLVFLRPVQSFENDMFNKKYRPRLKTKKLFEKIEQQYQPDPRTDQVVFPEVGEEIIRLMRAEALRNCKLILMCSVMDEISDVIRVFGLKDINRRIWANTDGLNKNNNTVYIIHDKHKTDIQRLLGSKLADYADNHVFIFGYKS